MRSRVLVSSYGQVWSITQKGWALWLAAHADGQNPSLSTFGGVAMGHAHNITDMSSEQALDELESEGGTLMGRLPTKERQRLRKLTYDESGDRADRVARNV